MSLFTKILFVVFWFKIAEEKCLNICSTLLDNGLTHQEIHQNTDENQRGDKEKQIEKMTTYVETLKEKKRFKQTLLTIKPSHLPHLICRTLASTWDVNVVPALEESLKVKVVLSPLCSELFPLFCVRWLLQPWVLIVFLVSGFPPH